MVPGGKNHASCQAGTSLEGGILINTTNTRINTKLMSLPEIKSLPKLMSLPEIIIDRIQKDGVLSFRDFMEMALYFPGYGYYTSDRQKIGKSGDFYTSPYLTGLFGEMIGGQLEEMWQILGRKPFTVVEYGAGTGLLCRDILSRLKQNEELYDKLQYVIIEKSGSMRARERELLPLFEKVSWTDSIRDIPAVTGCILSNELVDNFAVDQVVMEDELMEVCVSFDGGFAEMLRPAPEPLRDYLRCLGVCLPKGYRAEINLEATDWIQEVARALNKGFVMTIDYGYPSSALYSKSSGTLACYYQHQVHHCPYKFIGEQDITSHVNFSALDHWGRLGGLDHCGYTSQTHFLQGLGLSRYLRKWEEGAWEERGWEKEGQADPVVREQQISSIRTLLLGMGQKFKVLIQRKGVERVWLSGMQFPQPLI
jgi:SAM-dependent MidA family methyltransferase